MKYLKKLAGIFLSATAIGIYITLIITILCFRFLDARKFTQEKHLSSLFKTLEVAHLKTIDFRFVSRGPKAPSDQVALLAIDEKAVATVGRWPWPREKFAEAMANAVELGAKVLSLDIVFSEPSNHPIKNFHTKLTGASKIPSYLDKEFQSEIINTDGDTILSGIIKKYRNNFVLGTFAENETEFDEQAYFSACRNFIFELKKQFRFWDNDEYPLVVIDSHEFYMPEKISDTYKATLRARAEATRSSLPTPKSAQDRSDINREVDQKLTHYCRNWLDPEYDDVNEELAKVWSSIKEDDEDIEQASFEEWAAYIKSEFVGTILANRSEWVMNIDEISLAGMHTGYFNATQDLDGTIRRNSLVSQSGSHYYPSIGLKAFLVAKNYNAQIEIEPDPNLNNTYKSVKRLVIIDNDSGDEVFTVPVDLKANMMINYSGANKMFPHVSIAELLTNSPTATISQSVFDPESNSWIINEEITVDKKKWFKDKIFIVGATAIGIYDLRVTPFEKNFPGPETHVSVIDNLVSQDFLRNFENEEVKLPIYIFIFGIILSLLLSHLGAVFGFIITVFLGTSIILFDKHFYFEKGIVTTIIFPLMILGSIYVIVTFYKYFTEERKKKELKGTFAKYVSPSIVDEVLKDPENLELGGRKERMTVFFSDIRGFTTISEKLDPQALTRLLNEYLTPMTEIVFNNKGTLDKYMGDAIMAFFGAPLHYKNHAACACRASLQSLVKLKELQEDFEKRGLPTLDIGIGLNTGDMNVGNMGSKTVMSYTVMGDAVNLGARLEGINKQYGTRIIISEFTYEDVKDLFTCREIDWVRVKGKLEPVKIYELVSEGKAEEAMQQVVDHFNEGFVLYHQMEFEKALQSFSKALNVLPDDKCSQLYLERCQNYINEPPSSDWDGVFVMTTK